MKLEIENELKKTVGKYHYNGWNNRTNYGYHSYDIGEIHIQGQRNPKQRLDEIKKFVDFKDKRVLDLGCNVGAMLHHLPEIKLGVGIDYDATCIEAANNISDILGLRNLSFITLDFDKENFEITNAYDIIFILSIGSWVKNWREIYQKCLDTGATIILETNNDVEGKPQLEFFKDCKVECIINHSKDDCTKNNGRKTYLING
jgi:SAM-dependent methyltransferase